jgi:putrescine transport system ATP-binding protein
VTEIAIGEGFSVRAEQSEPVAGNAGFAVRPEKIRVSRTPPENPGVNSAEGEMWDIAYLGDVTVFHVKLKNGKVIKATSLNAQREVQNPLGYDDQVWISFDQNAGVVLRD